MASDVQICNLALSHIGDTASVSSIDPPEGSVQAEHCANFYPVARKACLEESSWGFSTTRAILAEVTNTWPEWQYAYAMPPNVINVLAVLPQDAPDDYEASYPPPDDQHFPPGYIPTPGPSFYTPQTYTVEIDSSGNQIILTNCPNAHLRYTTDVTDSTKFSPMFVMALSYLLASMLAGPIIKGQEGSQKAAEMLTLYETWRQKAEASDANQRRITPTPVTTWIAGR